MADFDDKNEDDSDFDDEADDFNNFEDFQEDESHVTNGMVPVELVNQWKQQEISISEKKINFAILDRVISMLERSWFWRFRSLESKIRMIYDAYYSLVDLVIIEE